MNEDRLIPNGMVLLGNQLREDSWHSKSRTTILGYLRRCYHSTRDYFFTKQRVDIPDGEISRIFDIRIGDLLFSPRENLYWLPYIALSDIYKCHVWTIKPSRYENFRQYLYDTFNIPLPKEEDDDE